MKHLENIDAAIAAGNAAYEEKRSEVVKTMEKAGADPLKPPASSHECSDDDEPTFTLKEMYEMFRNYSESKLNQMLEEYHEQG